jgi:ComF family protein
MVLSWLFPVRCPVCDAPGVALCSPCAAALQGPGPLAPVAALDEVTALYRYDGVARELLLALKYRNRRDVVPWLAEQLASAAPNVDPRTVDLVTWAPTSSRRRRRRGFDQAELLARATARMLRVPARNLLRRASSAPQTGRTADERRSSPAFTSRRRLHAGERNVLLLDDVGTTGATLAAAAAALRLGGAQRVSGLVVAWTPKPAPTSVTGVAS